MASDPNQILAALLAERGGSGAFNVCQLAAARQLAALLASDAAVGSGIAALVQLLPPVVREKTEPVNLGSVIMNLTFSNIWWRRAKARKPRRL